MKISIITATYNSATTILDCINSINDQTYNDIEHIIIDANSTDKTVEIIRSNPNRVIKIVSEPDKGIYYALNKGLSIATGDIVGFLHSDDYYASQDTISSIVGCFEAKININFDKTDGVYGDIHYIDRGNSRRIIRNWKSRTFQPSLIPRGWMPPHTSLFLLREVYDKHGCFDESFKISADYDFMLRIFQDNSLNFTYLPQVITKMRVGGLSNKGFRNIINKSTEDYLSICKNRIPHPWYVLFLKNINKFPQFCNRKGEAMVAL